tara:strand:- start:789 stop:1004 length:216 start_codon:yes stop_codon:yes gene_type:complete
MKHWKTKEEMGEGFSHTQKEHREHEYNSLVDICEHERNLMRTYYLIRDVWTLDQLQDLKKFLKEQIKERKE